MNNNLIELIKKIAADEEKQVKMQSFTNIDEAYDYAVSIQDGYSKEEFEAVMTKIVEASTEHDEISDDDLANIAGGADEAVIAVTVINGAAAIAFAATAV